MQLGGGSLRTYRRDILERVFSLIGLSAEQVMQSKSWWEGGRVGWDRDGTERKARLGSGSRRKTNSGTFSKHSILEPRHTVGAFFQAL